MLFFEVEDAYFELYYLTRAIQLTRSLAAGKTLRELNLVGRHHCLVTEVVRDRVRIEPSADLRLLRDDIVLISGERENVRQVSHELGRFERSTNETDIAVYAGGILIGLLIGSISISREPTSRCATPLMRRLHPPRPRT